MKYLIWCLLLTVPVYGNAQSPYKDSINVYLDKYVREHQVVKGEDKKKFRFFPIDESYQVTARIELVKDSPWFSMPASKNSPQTFRIYGILHFSIHDTLIKAPLYQSQMLMALQKYKDLLFFPFTDLTSGEDTYATGRYIDLFMKDIHGDTIVLDFNKAYNPYCAYVSGKYNCPIPPKDNYLPVAIVAGEMNFHVK